MGLPESSWFCILPHTLLCQGKSDLSCPVEERGGDLPRRREGPPIWGVPFEKQNPQGLMWLLKILTLALTHRHTDTQIHMCTHTHTQSLFTKEVTFEELGQKPWSGKTGGFASTLIGFKKDDNPSPSQDLLWKLTLEFISGPSPSHSRTLLAQPMVDFAYTFFFVCLFSNGLFNSCRDKWPKPITVFVQKLEEKAALCPPHRSLNPLIFL